MTPDALIDDRGDPIVPSDVALEHLRRIRDGGRWTAGGTRRVEDTSDGPTPYG